MLSVQVGQNFGVVQARLVPTDFIATRTDGPDRSRIHVKFESRFNEQVDVRAVSEIVCIASYKYISWDVAFDPDFVSDAASRD